MSKKLLNNTELDEYWDWYEDWGADDGNLHGLDKDDYEMICSIIDDLFQHIHHQQKAIARFKGEVMTSLGTLRKEVAEFKNRKSKVVRSIESEESERKRAKRAKMRGYHT